MNETKMSDIIRASMEGVRGFTNADTVIGEPINTPGGVTVIPVSRVTIGIATGGVDYSSKKSFQGENFGGGGGTGMSITPIAFLTVGRNAEVELIPLEVQSDGIERITSLIEDAPNIINRIKDALS